MRKLILMFFMFFSVTTFAQRFDVVGWSSEKSFAEVYGFGSAVSKDFNSKFLNQFLFGDTLRSHDIEDQFSKLRTKQNVVGVDYESAFRFKWKLNEKSSILFKFSDFAHADASVSQDLFGLVFKGNAAYTGDSLPIPASHVNLGRYQQLGFGYQIQLNKETSVYGMISYINANRAMSFGLYNAAIYTSAFGDTIDLDVFSSGYIANDRKLINGGGMAFSIGISNLLEFADSKWQLDATIENIGMIQWDLSTQLYNIDTSLLYVGAEINSVNENTGADVKRQFNDSILSGFDQIATTGWQNAAVPGYAQLVVNRVEDSGLALGFGATYRWNAVFKTFGWINAGYKFNSGFSALGEFGYGGYGKVQLGAKLAYETPKLLVQCRFSNFEALLSPKSSFGLTGFLGLQYRFEL